MNKNIEKIYYSSGEFASMAHVTVRTIRYYDKQNILKPSYVSSNGSRFYTDQDFARLQQILLLKYLGFSLDDIKEMTVEDMDYSYLLNTLKLQKKLVQDKIEQMHLVEDAITKTICSLRTDEEIDWNQMLNLIHLTGMEKSLKSQYLNSNNISARIRLHSKYSTNPQGWFPWMFEQIIHQLSPILKDSSTPVKILEVGCGDGSLWRKNQAALEHFSNLHITLSDISEGMIRDVRRTLKNDNNQFSFATFDCHQIPYASEQYDMVIANHVLFYCDDIATVAKEVRRVLKPSGIFCCSTYSSAHMHEITDVVQEFDHRIVLSADKLYEHFGLENGKQLLQDQFSQIALISYKDEIILNQAEPLIEYILSCHGNQNQYLLDRYHDFREFVEEKVYPAYHITKDAGVFFCHN